MSDTTAQYRKNKYKFGDLNRYSVFPNLQVDENERWEWSRVILHWEELLSNSNCFFPSIEGTIKINQKKMEEFDIEKMTEVIAVLASQSY